MEIERPIEKLLRAYAKKRCEDAGAPPELHAAVRRLLQGEVSRQCRAQRRQSIWSRLLGRLPLRLAWGLGILALMGVVTALLMPGLHRQGRPHVLASNERGQTTLTREAGRVSRRPQAALGLETNDNKLSAGTDEASALVVAKASDTLTAQPQAGDTAVTTAASSQTPALLRGLSDVKASSASGGQGGFSSAKTPSAEPPASPAPAQLSTQGDTLKSLAPAPGQEVASEPLPSGGGGGVGGGSMRAPEPPTTVAPVRRYGLAGAPPGGIAKAEPPVAAPAALPSNRPTSESSVAAASADGAGFRRVAGAKLAAGPEGAVTAATGAFLLSGDIQDRFSGAYKEARRDKDAPAVQYFARAQGGGRSGKGLGGVSGAAAILTSFTLEQSGSELRITDSDGSVYTGNLQPTNALPRPTPVDESVSDRVRAVTGVPPTSQMRPAEAAAKPQVSQHYFFQVAGTNHSLNQAVAFSGRLTRTTDSNALPSSRVLGKAVLGGRQEVPVEAVSRKP